MVRLALQCVLALFAIYFIFTQFHADSYVRGLRAPGAPSSEQQTGEDGGLQGYPFQQPNEVVEKQPNRNLGDFRDSDTASLTETVSETAEEILRTTSTSSATESTRTPDHNSEYTTSVYSSPDGLIQHWVLQRPPPKIAHNQTVLSLVITRDNESFGRNPTEETRSIYSFLDFVTNTTLDASEASFAILTSSKEEYAKYQKVFTPDEDTAEYYEYPFQRVTVVLHQAETRASPLDATGVKWDGSNRASRHNVAQHERRAVLAKLRNYLQFVALAEESHLLWFDSDVYKFNDKGMVRKMMQMTNGTADSPTEIGLLTARCRRGEPELAKAWMAEHPEFKLPDNAHGDKKLEEMRGSEGGKYEIMAHLTNAMGHYDLNAWSGRRTGPNNMEQEKLWKDLTSWTPSAAPDGKTKMLDGLADNLDDDGVAQLDSVGGTILMIRADLVRMGLVYSTGYIVGMTWEHGEGWDGIETEGICLLSRTMSRDGQSMCYTMGGEWVSRD